MISPRSRQRRVVGPNDKMRSATSLHRGVMVSLLLTAGAIVPAAAQQQDGESRVRFENEGVLLRVAPRTPEQIAAFYEGRGFPATMIARVAEACLLTVGIRHHRPNDVVWLELDRWRFLASDGATLVRLDRPYWERLWEQLDVPKRFQATFGWTQLPEVRDLRFDEPVGGNVALVVPPGEFALEARFRTGAAKSGPELVARIERISCPGRARGGEK